ncbi:LamG-like jellyroll fold domain-containing protein [Nitrosovibrio tenuis]|uniref:Concanavalin A-like lectin/glucanases superfamily protein n=1 Tax=Nitrosovibrio tenuis TaxID=1233 RepID=A0A1H7IR69_9PROT|nr:LamG-like jellyroll fold domain-containing protein [Nitrosovibrio tenuis]SEK64774.1 Concanavalin A-like lectin/glucanases superfamily protein [Nitrosovibrio tenuis]
MSALLLPNRFKQQPQYAAALNDANLLTRHIEQAYFAAGWQLNDAGNSKRSFSNTGASISVGRDGPAFKTSGSTSSYFTAPSAALIRFSLEAHYIPNAAASQYICGIQEAPNAVSHDRELRIDSAGRFLFYIYAGAPKQAISISSAAVNIPVHLLGVSDGTNIYLYVNGVLEATTAAGDAYGGYASPEFVIGAGQTDAGVSIPGSGLLNYAVYFNKALNASEARSRYDNKFSLLRAPARRIFSASSSNLIAAACIQTNTVGVAAIVQDHILAGTASSQGNTGGTTAVSGNHGLAGAASAQGNASGIGAVAYAFTLAGGAASQSNTAGTGAAVQVHVLLIATAVQANDSRTAGIAQAYILLPSSSAQINTASTGTITLGNGGLAPAPSAQGNITAAGAIIQAHVLAVMASGQGNSTSTGVISDGIVVESLLATGTVVTPRTKKPGVPAGTPEWLKTMIEILTGRRANKIAVPGFQLLTFSAIPTKAECEALYAYTNTVRHALEQLISRMDG